MSSIPRLFLASLSLLALPEAGGAPEEGWISLFDGKSLEGWRGAESPASFKVEGGAILAQGPRGHLFYAGPVESASFKDFELRAEVLTKPGTNSGLYFHTEYQEKEWPAKGYEVQIMNSSPSDSRRTGGLSGVRNVFKSPAKDDAWFELFVSVRNHRIQVKVDGVLTADYVEPAKPSRRKAYAARVLSRGTFALQCHDPQGRVSFRSIRVKPLPGGDADPANAAAGDDLLEGNADLQENGFPLIDFHAHLKGGLTLEEALRHSRKVGINYGIAANCGVGFPITRDEDLLKYLASLEGQPVFKGMQAEGREWVKLFSREAISKADYVFTDAMTFTDDRGKRTRLWIKDEVEIKDKEAFMQMYMDRILKILSEEPIDIFVNPTFLPEIIRADYDALWTEARMDKVIAAAVKNGIAIEINSNLKLPSAKFIRRAKAAGAKFSLGTNNGDARLGRLEYSIQMVRECGLTSDDMFLPGRRARR